MQRSQLPQPLPSDRVLVDLENGLMWYTEIAPARTFASAAAFATNFKLDGSNGVKYSDWRLPTQNELQSLQARGRFCGVRVPNVPVNSEDTTWGQTVSGLAGLGFQEAQRLEPYADVWCRDKWPIYRSGRLHQTYQYVYRLNRKPPEAGLTNLALRSQDKHPFVMVRSIGTNLHPPLHPEVNPALAEPSAIQPGEVYALGVPVEVNTLLQSYEEVGGVLRYAIVVGGGFHYGQGGERERFDLAAHRQDITAHNFSDLAYEALSSSLLRVLNLPGREGQVLWKTTDTSSQTVNVKASILGYREGSQFPVELSLEKSLNILVKNPRKLVRLRIFPRNRFYGQSVTQEQFTAVGSFSDGTVADLTDEAEWSITGVDGSTAINGARFAANKAGYLLLDHPNVADLHLHVRLGQTQSDQTNVQVAD